MNLDNVHVVLVQTSEPQNLGAVARAMRNCELSRLTLVEPLTDDLVTARRVAVHAEELLDAPRTVSPLSEAVADAIWVVGTTSRIIPGVPRLTPREVAARAAELTDGGEVALVFGGESSGLTNDHLLSCHAVSYIPAGPIQPSFNLAQAVLVYAYELHEAFRQGMALPAPAEPRAPDRELAMLETVLRKLLDASGFPDPDRPRHGVRNLAQTLRRAGLTLVEAKLWHAALRVALRAAERGGGRA